MHINELGAGPGIARGPVDGQFPEYPALPISPADSLGTVNHIYRLGKEQATRRTT